ncbi:MAG: extensin family protein [bacterium]
MKRGLLTLALITSFGAVACGDDPALQGNSGDFSVSADRLPVLGTNVAPSNAPNVNRPGETSGSSATCADGSSCPAGEACAAGTNECVPGGAFRITLIWEQATDLDLHVKTPLGEEVYYRHRNTADGGEFTKDGCIASRCEETGGPFIETVRWADFATAGSYEFWAVNYDGEQQVPIRIEVELEGEREVFNGTVGASVGAKSETFVYTIEGMTPSPNATTQCLQTLDQLGIQWTQWDYSTQSAGGKQCTVDEPIRVSGAINGVTYRYYNQSSPGTMSMTCELALALHRAGTTLKEYGINDVKHVGTFNCRTISGSTSLSNHAHGSAIDFWEFRTAGGTTYNFERDWQHNTTNPTSEKARVLYEIAQKWHANRVFNIILTPNYNRDHDNHIHADLTPGANTIRSSDGSNYYIGDGEDLWDEACGGHDD